MYTVSSKLILYLSLQALETANMAIHFCEDSLGKFTAIVNVMILMIDLKLKTVLKNLFSKLNHGTVPELSI